jgi:hypothetical protein
MPQTRVYLCQCSKCHGKSKFHTKRTIESHLSDDQRFLMSLPRDPTDLTSNRTFVESCINQTIQLLSRTRGGHLLPHTASDAAGSYLEDPEGVQLRFFSHSCILTLLLLFITLKRSLILQITKISKLALMFFNLNAMMMPYVTDLQGPPSEHTQSDKIRDLKSFTQQYARDRGSCDDKRISYLEFVESEAEADLMLARMIAG